MKTQLCPYGSENGSPVACGDWCPMFGEPVFLNDWDKVKKDLVRGKGASLPVCNKELEFAELIDEREENHA